VRAERALRHKSDDDCDDERAHGDAARAAVQPHDGPASVQARKTTDRYLPRRQPPEHQALRVQTGHCARHRPKPTCGPICALGDAKVGTRLASASMHLARPRADV
jgi:hypothetical protein